MDIEFKERGNKNRTHKMNKSRSHIDKIGWRFDNTYARLPDIMLSRLSPVPVKSPKLIVVLLCFTHFVLVFVIAGRCFFTCRLPSFFLLVRIG